MKTVSTKLLENFVREAVRAKLAMLVEGTEGGYVGDSGNMKVGSGQGGPESPRASGVQLSGHPMMEQEPGTATGLDEEAEELYLYITGELEQRRGIPIRKHLMRKMVKGVYNPELAVKLWMYLVDDGAKMYKQEYGSEGTPLFAKPVRVKVANRLARDFEEAVRHKEYTVANVLGK